MRDGKVFIDANILIYGATFKSANVYSWIDSLYKEKYIHQQVIEELLVSNVRKKVEQYIDQGKWKLFNPDDENSLPDDDFAIYESYLNDMRRAFTELDKKKIKENRPLKYTNDLGEIHSLAAALLLGASIICSNDLDIKEVIHDTPIYTTSADTHVNVLIQQDTLVDLCYYTINKGIEKSQVVHKFLNVVDCNKTPELEKLLSSR